MKKRRVSLRTHVLMLYFAAAFLIVGIFLLSNVLLVNQVYINNNKKEMKSIYTQLSHLVADEGTSVDDLKEAMLSIRDMQNVSFALEGNREWEFMVVSQEVISEHELSFLEERLQANLLDRNQTGVRILEQEQDYTIQYVVLENSGRRYLECYGYMQDHNGTDRHFILSMQMENVFQALQVTRMLTIYIALIVLIIGYLLITFISFRVTEPIYQLTEISKHMRQLDFSARYTGNSNDEIGELGNNMNELSSQLERTILQLKLANENLQKELEEKEHVDEMRKDFISNVSHELKTPIALMQGYAEALKEFKDDPDNMDYYCDVIMDESEKMARMVSKLTALNRLEFGGDELDIQPFDIMEEIRHLVHDSAKMQEEHQAEVIVKGPTSAIVLGDPYKIEEVLNNYYSNAYNHLDGARKIEISYVDLGPNVRISVKNTGNQIPEDELEKIWIKFYKVDKARTRAYGGSGLGLSIVKAIMDAHHAECGAYNVEDGVVFWFELKKFGELVVQHGSDYGEVGTSTSE